MEINMKKVFISAALAGVFAASAAMSANAAEEKKDAKKVKCYGIAKTGKNDCKSASGSHGCAGYATKDNDPDEFSVVTDDVCKNLGGKAEEMKNNKAM